MSRTRQVAPTAPGDARERGRRWYRLRPEPRRRTDYMGLNSTWWMALGWLVLLVVAAFPFPWWW